ncbi:IS3 family transposase [Paenibacillus sp. 32352]|uniref:IS3 family transposase n=1 Tax=Paenibacillus vulneris TaxID=1133364 RepID=A0ABW3UVG8_9BACL|nr:IS3 family transposase [Paenibacillus sp. 32352]
MHKYQTFEQLKNDIDAYIHFYNYERLQKKTKQPQPHGIQG